VGVVELAVTVGTGTLGKGERGSSEPSTKPQKPSPCRVHMMDLLQEGYSAVPSRVGMWSSFNVMMREYICVIK